MEFKAKLNQNQYAAVTTDKQFVRVVAGAGTGKTRVLTYRILYLMSELNIEPYNILAITFTNKAAKEMLERMTSFLPELGSQFKISTFHALAARFLRSEIQVLGYTSNFVILDEQEQASIIKRILEEKTGSKPKALVNQILSFIEDNSCDGLNADCCTSKGCPSQLFSLFKEIFAQYEIVKFRTNSLDFNDLLTKTVSILHDYPIVREKWKRRFKHILVDEFQDTNPIQFELIRLLMCDETSLYVVGDPDQTIYTWRGARQEIIANLHIDYPGLETIVLDTNYRSTQSILTPANKLISHNKGRIHKDLISTSGEGTPVSLHSESFSGQEASYVCRNILDHIKNGYSFDDMVVLYRANYQSLPLEKMLLRYNIPYVIYGSVKFYQREEVKDVIAYFNLLVNGLHDVSFLRIVNVPRRGIGDTSLNRLQENASKHDMLLTQYVFSNFIEEEEKEKLVTTLRAVYKPIEKMSEKLGSYRDSNQDVDDIDRLKDAFNDFIDELHYYEYLQEKFENGPDRIENVKTLIGDVVSFMLRDYNNSFEEYLQNVALLSHQDEIENGKTIKLMTVHIAKGLEFPIVYLYGFMDSVFPSSRAVAENGNIALEEERRLAYVAFTRAMKELIITFNSDYNFATSSSGTPSRFLEEAGVLKTNRRSESQQKFKEFFQTHREHYTIVEDEDLPPIPQPKIANSITWCVGDTAKHETFGRGKVIAIDDKIVTIEFDDKTRKLLANHHTLSKENN